MYVDITRISKIVCKKNWGRNKIFRLLRKYRYIGEDNIPYQRHIDSGLFSIVVEKYHMPYGKLGIHLKPLIDVEKGIPCILELINKE